MQDIPEISETSLRLAVALILGFLVGLERQFSSEQDDDPHPIAAGVRTFSFIGLLGALSALAAQQLNSPIVYAAALLSISVLVSISYYTGSKRGSTGLTSEVAIIIVFLIGSLCWWGQIVPAIVIAITLATLLSIKMELHGFAQRLSSADVVATLKFAIITGVALPFIPNESFFPPPLDVINPFSVWLMVVFISAIDYIGYITIKLVGSSKGALISGFLGGLASSTATTLSFAKQSKVNSSLAKVFVGGILASWSVMFVRMLVEAFVIDRVLFFELLSAMLFPLFFIAVFLIFLHVKKKEITIEKNNFSNPFELRTAFYFAALYAFILVLSRSAEMYLGKYGLYISSFASGMADVDAITLSVSKLRADGLLELQFARNAVLIAMISNTLVKGGIVISIADKQMRKPIAIAVVGIIIFTLIATQVF